MKLNLQEKNCEKPVKLNHGYEISRRSRKILLRIDQKVIYAFCTIFSNEFTVNNLYFFTVEMLLLHLSLISI